jgi:hypothetical protein
MGESIAQPFAVNDAQRRDEIAFDGAIAVIDHNFRSPSPGVTEVVNSCT